MFDLKRSSAAAYLTALIGTLLVLGLGATLPSALGAFAVTTTFILIVLAAGILDGWKPCLLAALLSVVGWVYFFVDPPYSFRVERPRDLVGLIGYLVVGAVIGLLCEGLHAARRRIEERQKRLEQEVVERRKAQQSEQEQAERLRVTLASIGDAVVTTDAAGRITYMNPVAESLTGWSLPEGCSRPLGEVVHLINEQSRAAAENPVQKVLRDGLIVGLANHTVLVARDGREHPVDDSAAPIRDAAGAIVGVVMIFRDVTEHRQSELAVERAAAQLRMITDSMSAPVVRCSRDLRYLWVNNSYEKWLGRSAKEIVGRPIVDVLGPDAFEQLRPRFEEVLSGVEVRYEDAVNIRGLGVRWVKGIYSPTFDDTGAVDGWVAVVIDIDDHKRAERALIEADRRKDEFLATLAHELRNPLAPISNAVELLRVTGAADEQLTAARDIIDRQLRQMTHLIDDLLDVSRITHNTLHLRTADIDVRDAIASAVETAQPLIRAAEHELCVSIPDNPVYVHADVTRLAQIISNLLNNAAKYTDRGGRIWLTVDAADDEVVVSVRDTGIGIDADLLPQVFDMFSQGDRALERSRGGLGIGLTLVRRLVEMHGGRVEASSPGTGQGSEFQVRLPILARPPALDARPVNNHPRPLGGSKILVVDDNLDSAQSLATLLKVLGGDVRTAFDGIQALDVAEGFRPDVLLLDIGLPELSGYEVCRRIRQLDWGRDTTIVALTGWGQPSDLQNSKDAGFDHHLVKPVDHNVLVSLLQ